MLPSASTTCARSSMPCVGWSAPVYLPHDFPPPQIVQAQAYRWMQRGVFEDRVHDLPITLRRLQGKDPQPSAAIYDARTLQSTPESGERAGYDGHKRRKGSKIHAAVDTLGHLLALVVTPADAQEREQVAELSQRVQEASGERVRVAFVDQGYRGEAAGIELCVGSRGASSCHPNAGWWSVGWPGCQAFAGWRGTTSGWPAPF